MKDVLAPDNAIEAERQKRLRVRNLAVLMALVAFAVLVFAVSIIKMQMNS